MQISAVPKEINEWSGSVLIAGILEGTIESQINLFKAIIKGKYGQRHLLLKSISKKLLS